MMSMSFKYTIIQKFQSYDDIQKEIKGLKLLYAKHDILCRLLATWKSNIQQNNSQLEILNDMAMSLSGRHKMLTDTLALRPHDPEILLRLKNEFNAVETQVDIWIRELMEIHDDRMILDVNNGFEFVQMRSRLQKSLTNIELAHIDLENLQKQHHSIWKKFLTVNNNKKQQQKQQFVVVDENDENKKTNTKRLLCVETTTKNK